MNFESLSQLADEWADDHYPESPLAPENERLVEVFAEGSRYALKMALEDLGGAEITQQPEGESMTDNLTVGETADKVARLWRGLIASEVRGWLETNEVFEDEELVEFILTGVDKKENA